jgi:hypothetical protein
MKRESSDHKVSMAGRSENASVSQSQPSEIGLSVWTLRSRTSNLSVNAPRRQTKTSLSNWPVNMYRSKRSQSVSGSAEHQCGSGLVPDPRLMRSPSTNGTGNVEQMSLKPGAKRKRLPARCVKLAKPRHTRRPGCARSAGKTSALGSIRICKDCGMQVCMSMRLQKN